MKYPVGTRLVILTQDVDAHGVVITSEELMSIFPKIIMSDDICVKWLNRDGSLNCASTYDKEWLDQNSIRDASSTGRMKS